MYKVYMNRVKEAVLAILFMLFTLSTFAQTGSVKGKIIDAKTKKPLEFVNVSIRAIETQKPLTGTVSDSTGVFRINRVKARKGIRLSWQQGECIERAFEAHLGYAIHEDSFDSGRLVQRA